MINETKILDEYKWQVECSLVLGLGMGKSQKMMVHFYMDGRCVNSFQLHKIRNGSSQAYSVLSEEQIEIVKGMVTRFDELVLFL